MPHGSDLVGLGLRASSSEEERHREIGTEVASDLQLVLAFERPHLGLCPIRQYCANVREALAANRQFELFDLGRQRLGAHPGRRELVRREHPAAGEQDQVPLALDGRADGRDDAAELGDGQRLGRPEDVEVPLRELVEDGVELRLLAVVARRGALVPRGGADRPQGLLDPCSRQPAVLLRVRELGGCDIDVVTPGVGVEDRRRDLAPDVVAHCRMPVRAGLLQNLPEDVTLARVREMESVELLDEIHADVEVRAVTRAVRHGGPHVLDIHAGDGEGVASVHRFGIRCPAEHVLGDVVLDARLPGRPVGRFEGSDLVGGTGTAPEDGVDELVVGLVLVLTEGSVQLRGIEGQRALLYLSTLRTLLVALAPRIGDGFDPRAVQQPDQPVGLPLENRAVLYSPLMSRRRSRWSR